MTFRSSAMLRMSKGETCVRCGLQLPTVVGAHYTGVRRNSYGGGLGIKVHDCLVADLCQGCHEYIDRLSRDKEGRWGHSEEFLHYVALTVVKRFESGKWHAGKLKPAHEREPPHCSTCHCEPFPHELLTEAPVNNDV